jgi:hypothetical protein
MLKRSLFQLMIYFFYSMFILDDSFYFLFFSLIDHYVYYALNEPSWLTIIHLTFLFFLEFTSCRVNFILVNSGRLNQFQAICNNFLLDSFAIESIIRMYATILNRVN